MNILEIKQENNKQNNPSKVNTEINKDNILSAALEKATLTIEKLNNEIKTLQSSKMWNLIIGNTEDENNYNKQTEKRNARNNKRNNKK